MDEQQGSPGRKLFNRDDINWRGILILILVVVITIIAIILISNLSEISADIAGHINRLFGRATINPNDPQGFASFMELVFIAIFAGWAINRFRRK